MLNGTRLDDTDARPATLRHRESGTCPAGPSSSRYARSWTHEGILHLESGAGLDSPTTVFETWGALDGDRSNAVLLAPGLSPSSHAASHSPSDHPGWWESMVGPGRAIDTTRWFVVCPNNLGSCFGTTGPSSTDPATGRPYGPTFPFVTLRDIVTLQRRLLDHLEVPRLAGVVGSSMGGMLALEYAALFPDTVERVVSISASGRTHPYAVALRRVQRRSVMLDPRWKEGAYYDSEPPIDGLALAREIGTISYRSGREWSRRFGRSWQGGHLLNLEGRFAIESYLEHQGAKAAASYDANSYVYLSRAMDLHDLGRGRGGLRAAAARIAARVLLIGVTTDVLIPPSEIEELAGTFAAAGRPVRNVSLDLDSGHDSFLVHPEAFGPLVQDWLESRLLDREAAAPPTLDTEGHGGR